MQKAHPPELWLGCPGDTAAGRCKYHLSVLSPRSAFPVNRGTCNSICSVGWFAFRGHLGDMASEIDNGHIKMIFALGCHLFFFFLRYNAWNHTKTPNRKQTLDGVAAQHPLNRKLPSSIVLFNSTFEFPKNNDTKTMWHLLTFNA